MVSGTAVRCWLFTASGELLSEGDAALPNSGVEPGAEIAFWAHQPSRIIRSCLLDRLQDVRLQMDDGSVLRARVEQVFFQPPHGRCCRLRILSLCYPSAPGLDTVEPLTGEPEHELVMLA